MAHVLWFLVPAASVVISHLLPLAAASDAENMVAPSPLPAPLPDCPSRCGNVDIPYPFGIGEHCSWQGKFILTCNDSFNPPRPYIGNIEVLNISLEAGEIRVLTLVSFKCTSINMNKSIYTTLRLDGQLLISTARNEFTATGCSTLAYLQSSSYYTGCITSCVSLDSASQGGDKCTGLGCCQMSIPANLTGLQVSWGEYKGDISSRRWNPCGFAFVAEKNWYEFQRDDLRNKRFVRKIGDRNVTEVPLVIDWAIRDDESCPPLTENNEVLEEPTASACVSANSHCVNASQGSGYLCQCSKGYTGNPYINGGCTNINECELRKSDPMKYEKLYPCGRGSTCYDTPGDYKCKCNFGRRGDGKSDTGCERIFPGYAIAVVATFVASVLSCFMIMELKRRKQKRFFDKNGGEILKNMGINIFKEEELNKITNRYRTPIGEGAFGKVFMGTIDNGQRVAVKRASMKGEVLPQEEFVNEITFQFRISHTNVVRLLGCCLETDIPMLVFELVPRGSLYSVLHGTQDQHTLSLPERLGIAIGSAEALAHMHSHGGHNHVHGDIKSGNILLDEDLTPKVSDFGSSKLVSVASMYSKWCVSGDMSYIDPVYIKSGRYTEKSDVYSFGVVLLELVTRKTAKYGDKSLPLDFLKCFKEEGNGRKLYDRDIINNNNDAQSHCHMECLDTLGKLAVRCLKEDVDERPTMAEVAEELKQVKSKACGDKSTQVKKADC